MPLAETKYLCQTCEENFKLGMMAEGDDDLQSREELVDRVGKKTCRQMWM